MLSPPTLSPCRARARRAAVWRPFCAGIMPVATTPCWFYNGRGSPAAQRVLLPAMGGDRDEDLLGTLLGAGRAVWQRARGIGRRSRAAASRSLHAGATSTRGHPAVHLFLADASSVAAPPAESLWLLPWPVRLRRSLRPQLSGLLLLAGVDRLLSRGSRLLRWRRRAPLRDLALGFSVPLR
jgi:hypothetical protein